MSKVALFGAAGAIGQSIAQALAAAQRAGGGTQPEATVDDEMDTTAVFCRNELVYRGIDRGVFSTDSEPGDHPENREAPEIPRERD